jgi:hypothetical protein
MNPMKDTPEEGTPRAAVAFLGMAALAVIPIMKNPGRRKGAKLEIEKAVRQLNLELTRLYSIERTARALFDAPHEEHFIVRLNEEENAALEGLQEALGVEGPHEGPDEGPRI